MKPVYVLIFLAFSATAFAGPNSNCDRANQTWRDEPIRQVQRNTRIAFLNGQIAKETDEVQQKLTPEHDLIERTVHAYDDNANATSDAVTTINSIVPLVYGAIASNREFQIFLDRLSNAVSPDGTQPKLTPLSKLIENAILESNLSESEKLLFNQFASQVKLLEASQRGWLASENKAMQDAAQGLAPLSDGLLEKLRVLSENLNVEYQQLKSSKAHVQEQLDQMQKAIDDEKAKIENQKNEIEQLKKDNERSRAEMDQWNPNKYCNFYHYTPPEAF